MMAQDRKPFDTWSAPQVRKPRPKRQVEIELCRACGNLHAYPGHDGQVQACGFCCRRHTFVKPKHVIKGLKTGGRDGV